GTLWSRGDRPIAWRRAISSDRVAGDAGEDDGSRPRRPAPQDSPSTTTSGTTPFWALILEARPEWQPWYEEANEEARLAFERFRGDGDAGEVDELTSPLTSRSTVGYSAPSLRRHWMQKR